MKLMLPTPGLAREHRIEGCNKSYTAWHHRQHHSEGCARALRRGRWGRPPPTKADGEGRRLQKSVAPAYVACGWVSLRSLVCKGHGVAGRLPEGPLLRASARWPPPTWPSRMPPRVRLARPPRPAARRVWVISTATPRIQFCFIRASHTIPCRGRASLGLEHTISLLGTTRFEGSRLILKMQLTNRGPQIKQCGASGCHTGARVAPALKAAPRAARRSVVAASFLGAPLAAAPAAHAFSTFAQGPR